jgi:hypothetical protein
MREKVLDIRDIVDETDALMAIGIDLKLPATFDYTWNGLVECYTVWTDPTRIRVIVEGSVSEAIFETFCETLRDLDHLEIERLHTPEFEAVPTLPEGRKQAALEAAKPKREQGRGKPVELEKAIASPPVPATPAPLALPHAVNEQEARAIRLIQDSMRNSGRSEEEIAAYLQRHFGVEIG